MAEPRGTEKIIAAKLLTICAVGMLISLGMCGAASKMRSGLFAIAGALVFVCCLLGCVVLLVIIGIGMLGRKL
jgi:hypothetical protein